MTATALPAAHAVAAPLTPMYTCSGAFVADRTPNPFPNDGLNATTALSSTDVWAVGAGNSGSGSSSAPITLHFDGRRWESFPAPSIGSTSNDLVSVSGTTANDVWAVGSQYSSNGSAGGLIEHWNGSAWNAAQSVPPSALFLSGVVAITASDAWAVGSNLAHTVVLHWDGVKWSAVTSPDGINQDNFLNGAAAVGGADLWVVGSSQPPSGYGSPLIENWNGISWTETSGAKLRAYGSLDSVAALSSSDVWAVGRQLASNGSSQSLVEHWNGKNWHIVPSPSAPSFNELTAVVAIATNDVWAFGYGAALHWNGSAWTQIPAGAPSGATADLASHRLWAVGTGSSTTGATTFAEHLCPA